MVERRHHAAQFGEALEPADRRIARLRAALEIVEDVLAVVGPHRDLRVGAALGAAALLLVEHAAITATMSVSPPRCSSSKNEHGASSLSR